MEREDAGQREVSKSNMSEVSRSLKERTFSKEIYLVSGRDTVIDFWVVLCLVCRLGFPGTLAETYGILTPLFDHGSSALELLLVFLAGADTIGEIRLLDLKKKYGPIYLMMGILLVQSFLVTSDRAAEFTTCLRLLITVVFALWMADHYQVKRLLELICKAQGIYVAINLFLLLCFRQYGYYYDEEGRYLFRGLASRKNALGEEMAFGIVLLITLFCLKKREKEKISLSLWIVLAAQGVILLETDAVGALFTASIPILYVLFHDKMQGRLPRLHWSYIYIVVSVGFLVVSLTVLPVLAPVFDLFGKDATLSNRTTMWEEIIPFMIDNHTFTGYGMLMFWNDKSALKALQDQFGRDTWFRSMTYGSHNTLLEMWLDVGLIGLALYFLVILYSFRRIRTFTEEQYLACSAFMIPIMIRGLTERSYTSSSYLTLFLFIMLGIACTGSELRFSGYPRRPFLPREIEEDES